jgi:hypothetical protein
VVDGPAPGAEAARHGIRLAVVKTPAARRDFVLLPRRWVVEIVFPQMAKADVFAFGGGGEHVANLHLVVGHDHPVDQQQ